MKIRPIYKEAENLYIVLARATELSEKDSSWAYVQERIDEVTTLYEELLDASKIIGIQIPLSLNIEISKISALVNPHDIIDRVTRIEEQLIKALILYKATKSYVLKSRLAAGFLVSMISGYILLTLVGSSVEALLTCISLGLGIASILTYLTRISPLVSFIGAVFLAPLLHGNPYLITAWSLTVIASATASVIPLVVPLRRG